MFRNLLGRAFALSAMFAVGALGAGTFTFTGGTGRFAGATGGGDLFAIAFLAEGLPFIGMYDGTIDY